MTAPPDRWYRWLREVRHGGDAGGREHMLAGRLYPVRDEILDRAGLSGGETVLDVGAGDGLVAFGALDRVGPAGHVIFADISRDLLDHCRAAADAQGVGDRCSFVRASAESLDGVADGSVDVITTRAVLMYVTDKAAALREFYRVLRPGGRVSLQEPVNRLTLDRSQLAGRDIGPVAAIAAKLRAFYDSVQPPDGPMLDFDDWDLVRDAGAAGFPEIHLDLRVNITNGWEPCPWEVFLRASANPLHPPFGEVLGMVLDPDEAEEFVRYFRPLIESGAGQERHAAAFLTAVKERAAGHPG